MKALIFLFSFLSMFWAQTLIATEPVVSIGSTSLVVSDGIGFVTYGSSSHYTPQHSMVAFDIKTKKRLWVLASPPVATSKPIIISGYLHVPMMKDSRNVIKIIDPKTGKQHGLILDRKIACSSKKWWLSTHGDAFKGGEQQPYIALTNEINQCAIKNNTVYLLRNNDNGAVTLQTIDLLQAKKVKSYRLPSYFSSDPKAKIGNYWKLITANGPMVYFGGYYGYTKLDIAAYDLEQHSEKWTRRLYGSGYNYSMDWIDDKTIVIETHMNTFGWGKHYIDAETGSIKPDFGNNSQEGLSKYLSGLKILYSSIMHALTKDLGTLPVFNIQNNDWLIVVTSSYEFVVIRLSDFAIVKKEPFHRVFDLNKKKVSIGNLILSIDDDVVIAVNVADESVILYEISTDKLNRVYTSNPYSGIKIKDS